MSMAREPLTCAGAGAAGCGPVAIERRRSPREERHIRILLQEERFATAGHTVNVSRHGALVRTAAPLRLGARYVLHAELEGAVRCGAARVVRELPGYIYALEFEPGPSPFEA